MSSVPFYMLSFLKVPKGVLKRWDYHRARMMWQETAGKKKYHPVNWPTVCLPKDSGGLGILDLADMNRSLFANGSGNWKILVEHGKRYWQRNTWITKCWLFNLQEWVALHFGRVCWGWTIYSSSTLSELLEMGERLYSGRTDGIIRCLWPPPSPDCSWSPSPKILLYTELKLRAWVVSNSEEGWLERL